MKVLPLLIVLLLTFGSATAQTQLIPETIADTSYTTMYTTLKKLYVKKTKSASHIKAREMMADFIKKAGIRDVRLAPKELMLQWIADNLYKTSFESYEAAVVEWDRINAVQGEARKENPELYEYIKKATKIHGREILAEVVVEVEVTEVFGP